MFEGNERLGLLIKGYRYPYDNRGLGFKGKNTHYMPKPKSTYFVKANEKNTYYTSISEQKKVHKANKIGPNARWVYLKIIILQIFLIIEKKPCHDTWIVDAHVT